MESFALTRVEMSSLLLSLTGLSDRKPLNILQEAWAKFHREELQKGTSLPAFYQPMFHPYYKRSLKAAM